MTGLYLHQKREWWWAGCTCSSRCPGCRSRTEIRDCWPSAAGQREAGSWHYQSPPQLSRRGLNMTWNIRWYTSWSHRACWPLGRDRHWCWGAPPCPPPCSSWRPSRCTPHTRPPRSPTWSHIIWNKVYIRIWEWMRFAEAVTLVVVFCNNIIAAQIWFFRAWLWSRTTCILQGWKQNRKIPWLWSDNWTDGSNREGASNLVWLNKCNLTNYNLFTKFYESRVVSNISNKWFYKKHYLFMVTWVCFGGKWAESLQGQDWNQ